MTIKTILAGLDRSPAAESVLPYVTGLAAALKSSVVLQTVIERESSSGAADTAASDYLRAIEDKVAKLGVPVSSVVSRGEAAAEIVAEARRQPDTLIVMGTHGRSGIARLWYGSVAERVLHMSPAPVMLLRARESAAESPWPIGRIVVPLDGQPLAEEVLPLAVFLGRELRVPMALIRVVPPPSLLDDPSLGLGASTYSDTRGALLLAAEKYLTRIADDVRTKGVHVTTQAVDGIPAVEILGTAQVYPNSLVIMAVHSRHGAPDVLLGSVTRRILHDSYVPVLTVRPRAFSQSR